MLAHLSAVLLTLGPVPAAAPPPLEPAPTGLTIAWDPGGSPGFRSVRVTWTESTDRRNAVRMVPVDGHDTGQGATIVAAGDPDNALLSASSIGDARIEVTAVDPDGKPTSEAAVSAVFDTDGPSAPIIRRVEPRSDGTILMEWTPVAYVDRNPGDPLDLPVQDPPLFVPVASQAGPYSVDELTEPSEATSFVVPKRLTPVHVGVQATPNEWGFGGAYVYVYGSKLTASVPRASVTGATIRVTGRSFRIDRGCDMAVCYPYDVDDPGRALQLQARDGGDWTTVATTRSGKDGKFAFSVVSPGTRQYRVLAPAVPYKPGRPTIVEASSVPVTTTATATGGGGGGGDTLPITGPGTAVWLGALLAGLGVLLRVLVRPRA